MQCYAPVVLIHANARTLGSYQADALQNITGRITDVYGGATPTFSGAFGDTTATVGGVYGAVGTTGLQRSVWAVDFKSSKVARTATETRGSNTAFAPRIIAF